MSVNFFISDCQTPNVTEIVFGICDDQNGKKAYIDFENESNWIARVENDHRVSILFTAIDNCIEIRRENGEMDSRCDGMLSYPENIVFVELKNQIKAWMADGLAQLEATIVHFTTAHDLSTIKHKRAILSNKRRAHFHVLDPELKRKFFDKYRVRINVDAIIGIKGKD